MNQQFGAIIIGDEILSGKRADQHLVQLIALLSARGLALAHAEYVGDDRPRLTAALARAFAGNDIVFSFGGIGATPDDHTRQCAAQALGMPLALHPEAVALINARKHVLSLPSVDHAEHGAHVELGIKGAAAEVVHAWPTLVAGVHSIGAKFSTEMVRNR